MSSFSFCFCSFISWQRSIIAAAVGVFSSAVCADCAWTGEQRARAKTNARLEQTTSCVFVWFFIFCSSPRFPTTYSSYPQQPPDLPSDLALAGVDRNCWRQWSLQKLKVFPSRSVWMAVVSSTVMPQRGSLVTEFDCFMVHFPFSVVVAPAGQGFAGIRLGGRHGCLFLVVASLWGIWQQSE